MQLFSFFLKKEGPEDFQGKGRYNKSREPVSLSYCSWKQPVGVGGVIFRRTFLLFMSAGVIILEVFV